MFDTKLEIDKILTSIEIKEVKEEKGEKEEKEEKNYSMKSKIKSRTFQFSFFHIASYSFSAEISIANFIDASTSLSQYSLISFILPS